MTTEPINKWTRGVETIAIVGPPRSGTTIVAKYINSIGGVFIVSEPYQAALKPRPPRMKFWPTIVETEYGNFGIVPEQDAWDQVKIFANRVEPGLSVIGFKECQSPIVNAADIAGSLMDNKEVDRTIVVMRHPRLVFESMLWNTPEGHERTTPQELAQMYDELYDLVDNYPEQTAIIFLDWFRAYPTEEVQKATGWSISGLTINTLDPLPGGGDPTALGSTSVSRIDTQRPSPRRDLDRAVEIYEDMWAPEAVYRKMSRKRILV